MNKIWHNGVDLKSFANSFLMSFSKKFRRIIRWNFLKGLYASLFGLEMHWPMTEINTWISNIDKISNTFRIVYQSLKITVTNFIQLIFLQLVDQFSQTKLYCKALNEGYLYICTYVRCTKATTNNWDIGLSVTVKSLFANISWMTWQIHMIKLVLESTHQTVSNDILYIS